jgi:hypothetical protein
MADTGANPGGASGAVDPNAGAAPSAAQPIDYKALLLQLLELDPSADDAAIQAAIAEEKAEPEVDTATTTAATSALQTQLETANARILELETAAQQAQQDEINELIEEAGELPDDAKTALRNALTTDRAGGTALLAAMKKPAAPAPPPTPAESAGAAASGTATQPPAPKHNPKGAAAGPTDAEKITQQNELISKIRKEGKFSDYESARAEARRQKPELFS